ncbi:hypothetical protein Pcinc_012238 [Petrolisthes cinctipes]|uniref:Nuclease HARBI1 n=1 Tax=Petrolisthes cinctipes TaxID=88211 RepID=A0AAE1KL58_PETCI|nr:hypothetical protein Pcinc_019730 [Petrolisthes cinctipes]KAK3883462.1 hypothetical protein Pcinc_012238 [Petrolisthes cinctipes]
MHCCKSTYGSWSRSKKYGYHALSPEIGQTHSDTIRKKTVKRYRLPKNAVQDLIDAIEPHAPRPNNDRGCSIPLFLQMLVTLRYLATGSFQLSVADCADMAVSPVCRCVGRISQLIAYLAPDYIKFPTPAEGHRLAQEYFSVAGIPGVTGCIDGTRIPIQGPGGENVEIYRCRKG